MFGVTEDIESAIVGDALVSGMSAGGRIMILSAGEAYPDLAIENHVALQVYAETSAWGVNLDTGKSFAVADGVASGLLIEDGGFYRGNAGSVIRDCEISGSRASAGGDSIYSQSVMFIGSGASACNVRLSSGAVLVLDGAFSLDNVTMDGTVTVVWTTFDPGFVLKNTVLNGFDNFSWSASSNKLTGWVFNGMGKNLFYINTTVTCADLTIKDIAAGSVYDQIPDYIDGLVVDINGAVSGTASTVLGDEIGDNVFYWDFRGQIRNLEIHGGNVAIDASEINGLTLENHYSGYNCSFSASGGTIYGAQIGKDCILYMTSERFWESCLQDAVVSGGSLIVGSGAYVRGGRLSSGAVLALSGDFRLNDVKMDSSVVVYWNIFDIGCDLQNVMLNGFDGFSWSRGGRELTRWVFNGHGRDLFYIDTSVSCVDLTIKDIAAGSVYDKIQDIDGLVIDINGAVSGTASTVLGGEVGDKVFYWDFDERITDLAVYGGNVVMDASEIKGLTLENHYSGYNCSFSASGGRIYDAVIYENCTLHVSEQDGGDLYAEDMTVSGGTVYFNGGEILNVTVEAGTMYVGSGEELFDDLMMDRAILNGGVTYLYRGELYDITLNSGGTLYAGERDCWFDIRLTRLTVSGGTAYLNRGEFKEVSLDAGCLYIGSGGDYGDVYLESAEFSGGTAYLYGECFSRIDVFGSACISIYGGEVAYMTVADAAAVYVGRSNEWSLGPAVRSLTIYGGTTYIYSGEISEMAATDAATVYIGLKDDFSDNLNIGNLTVSSINCYIYGGKVWNATVAGDAVVYIGGDSAGAGGRPVIENLTFSGGTGYILDAESRNTTITGDATVYIGCKDGLNNRPFIETLTFSGGTGYIFDGYFENLTADGGTIYFHGGTTWNSNLSNVVFHLDGFNRREVTIETLIVSNGAVHIECGSIENLNMFGGEVVISFDNPWNSDIRQWNLSGCSVEYKDACGWIEVAGRLSLRGGCDVYAGIRGDGELMLYGVGNNIYGENAYDQHEQKVEVRDVLLCASGLWFDGAAMVGGCGLDQLGCDVLKFSCYLGQNDYYLGDIEDWHWFSDEYPQAVIEVFAGKYVLDLKFENPFLDSDEVVAGGFRFSLHRYETEIRISVRAVAAQTGFRWATGWSSAAYFAPMYVCNLEDTTSGTLIFGAESEGSGGNRIANAFGGDMTGGIVTSGINSSVIYGGGSGTAIATTWVMVEGGTRNRIYGGGLGGTITDGTNIYIEGPGTTTMAVFGGGSGSTIFVGDHNVYAVNMEIVDGMHRYVYGGGDGGSISGDIEVSLRSCLICNLYSGAGNSSVSGNVRTTLNLPEYGGYKMTGNFYGGAVAAVDALAAIGSDTAIRGNVFMTLEAGEFQGLIFGGGRAWGTVAGIYGTINLCVGSVVSADNVKMLKYGSTAWVVGGSQIQNNGDRVASGSVTGGVVMDIGASKLVNVVGGGQATGSGCRLDVKSVAVNLSGTVVSDSIYAGGYAADGGRVVVGSVKIGIVGGKDAVTAVSGNIFAAGRTFGANAMVGVTGNVVVAFSGVAENIAVGMVDAMGRGDCTVQGGKTLSLAGLDGTLLGTFVNFDNVLFGGASGTVAVGNAVETAGWSFDTRGRSSELPFVTDAVSFNLVGDNRVIALSLDTTETASFNLMNVADEDLEGVMVRFMNRDGTLGGGCEFGGTIKIGEVGTVSLEVDRNGMLVAGFTKT